MHRRLCVQQTHTHTHRHAIRVRYFNIYFENDHFSFRPLSHSILNRRFYNKKNYSRGANKRMKNKIKIICSGDRPNSKRPAIGTFIQ